MRKRTLPQALDTHFRDPFDLPPPLSGGQVQKNIFDSLATKRYLVRVCKDWYQLASRFLYREIIIGRGHTLVSLRSTLLESHWRAEESATQAEETQFTPFLGQYTLRFEIATRIRPGLEDTTVISELETLIDIFRCLPNLQICIMAKGGPYHPIKLQFPLGVLSSLGSYCGKSLRVIRWHRYPHPTAPQWTQLLHTTSNLRILRFPSHDSNRGKLQSGHPLPHLMSLEGAESSDVLLGTALPNQIYPSLYHLSISPFLPPTFLLNSYGPQLTLITITRHTTDETINLLSTACPNLTKLVIHFSSPPNFPSRLPKSITHLGLRCNTRNRNIYDSHARPVFEGLKSIQVPNLQVVRFLDRRFIEVVRDFNPNRFAWGVELLAETRYRIEDCDGVAIRPQSRSIPHSSLRADLYKCRPTSSTTRHLRDL
ncbi:hypothetical protein JAAARDRAFT_206611 [Jaapia argillacea MUCL 33604]|uniref:F-box domain-containing protein n=1 Tax=Jaapia argillacea MUCL 33604 TaxID=933084 RepID=A0A067Q842_9AGAM|nr:hypothetical protein JAAARDRAFT_206611 [Jaapia argillacea MUCL 33604]